MDIKYLSQIGQDEWVCNYFNFKRNGFFLDVGAHDGIELSNTYVLEKRFGWNGICVDANPHSFGRLLDNRNCHCLNVGVSDYEGTGRFMANEMYSYISDDGGEEITIKTIDTILKMYNAPKVIDYFSLDVEGCESKVLSKFPFDEYECILITVEHNEYAIGNDNKNKIKDILLNNGYDMFKEDTVTHFEDWYINKKYNIEW